MFLDSRRMDLDLTDNAMQEAWQGSSRPQERAGSSVGGNLSDLRLPDSRKPQAVRRGLMAV
jgi:hypothetical protein